MKTIVITTTMKNSGNTGSSAFIMCDADLVQTVKNVIESNSDAASNSTSTYCIGGTLSAEQLTDNDLTIWEKRSTQDDASAAIELEALLLANNDGRVVAPTTSGHLANNGGIRGHSAGDFYPFRVMAKGIPSDLFWHVIGTQGKTIAIYTTSAQACDRARREFNKPAGATQNAQ